MIFTDRARVDSTLRKLTHSDNTVENVHIEEVENNVTTNGTPLNGSNFNTQEKNIGTYGTDTYDNTATYDVGDIVTYEGLLYRCKTQISTPETFNSAHWDQISLLDMTEENTASIKTKANSADLSIVATTGSYTDLSNKPIVNTSSVEIDEAYSCNYINSLIGTIQYPTYTNGQDISSTRRTYFQKIGNRVFINLNVNVTISANQYLAIFDIPEAYKPKYEVYTVAARSGYDNYLQIYANPSGTIGLFSSGALTNSNIAGEISFIIDE